MPWTMTRTPPYDHGFKLENFGPNGTAISVDADAATGRLKLDTKLNGPRRARRESASAFAAVVAWLDPPPGQTMTLEANFSHALGLARNTADRSLTVASDGTSGLFVLELDGFLRLAGVPLVKTSNIWHLSTSIGRSSSSFGRTEILRGDVPLRLGHTYLAIAYVTTTLWMEMRAPPVGANRAEALVLHGTWTNSIVATVN